MISLSLLWWLIVLLMVVLAYRWTRLGAPFGWPGFWTAPALRRAGGLVLAAVLAAALAWWVSETRADVSGEAAGPRALAKAQHTDPSAAGGKSLRTTGGAPQAAAVPRRNDPAGQMAWQSARKRFAIAPGLATAIQDALADPTASKLFHMTEALNRCGTFEVLASSRAAAEASVAGAPREVLDALKELAAVCEDVSALHGSFRDTFYKMKAARERLDPESRALLDAIEGKGPFAGAPIRSRFAAASTTRDPMVLAAIGSAWAMAPNASLSGKAMDPDARGHFVNAWHVAACEADDVCKTSVGSFRLCLVHGLCTESVRERFERGLEQGDVLVWREAFGAVAEAIRSGDFSPFE